MKHHDDRYSLKIGFAVDTILTEYERECVGRKLADLAAENELLKAKLDAVRELCQSDTNRIWTVHRGYQTMVEASDVLAIIDKDGDAT